MSDVSMLPPVTLFAAASVSSSAGTVTSTPVVLVGSPKSAAFQLTISQSPTSSGALDVYVQHSVNYVQAGPASSNGTAVWDDFVHFTQAAGSSNQSIIAGWSAYPAPSSSVAMHQTATGSLAAGQIRNGPTGAAWRVAAVVSSVSPVVASSSAYAMSVVAQVYR